MIYLAVSTQYKRVTDGQTDTIADKYTGLACRASCGKNELLNQ